MNLCNSHTPTEQSENQQTIGMEKKTRDFKLKYQHISDEVRNQIVTRFLVDGHKLIDVSKTFRQPL